MESRFRINAKHLFLTYPRCTLISKLPSTNSSSSLLQRGSLYLVKIMLTVRLISMLMLGFTPSAISQVLILQTCSCILTFSTATIKQHVLSRQQSNMSRRTRIFSNFDIEKPQDQKNRRAWASDQIVNHRKPLHELVIEDPQLIFGYNRLLQDVSSFCRDCSAKTSLDLPPFLPNPWGLVLPSTRAAKRRHFWLWSEKPNVGKSFFLPSPRS